MTAMLLSQKSRRGKISRLLLGLCVGLLVAVCAPCSFAYADDLELAEGEVLDLGTDYSDPYGSPLTRDVTNNHTDTLYQKLLGAKAIDNTPPRLKMDYSSSYIYYYHLGNAVSVEVWGWSSGNGYVGLWPTDGTSRSNYVYYPHAGTAYYLINYVKENGYSYAALHIDRSKASNPSGTVEVKFLWSPDSI